MLWYLSLFRARCNTVEVVTSTITITMTTTTTGTITTIISAYSPVALQGEVVGQEVVLHS